MRVQPYLPSQTPPGLRSYRNKDLEEKRGDGRGQRKSTDRIYDYDTYNDLGDPENDADKARPVLGGSKQFPYPRRCRTGRPMSTKDPKSETRKGDNYVPRDEAFSDVKQLQFSVTTLRSVLSAAVPAVQSTLIDPNRGFPSFFVIDKLFEDGVKLPEAEDLGFLRGALPRLLQKLRDSPGDQILLFDTPANVNSTSRSKSQLQNRSVHEQHEFPVLNSVWSPTACRGQVRMVERRGVRQGDACRDQPVRHRARQGKSPLSRHLSFSFFFKYSGKILIEMSATKPCRSSL